ncbi:MAG: response regulator [Saccharofermentanales bacterium]
MIRLLIVDDEPEVAVALTRNIDGNEGIRVVGFASDGQEAIRLCEQLQPDVILMDIRMPVVDGLSASKSIKEKHPDIKIIILTLFKEEEQILKAVQSDCDGYLFKGNKSENIISAIKSVHSGLSAYDHSAQSVISSQMKNSSAAAPVNHSELSKLSGREIEIVRLMTSGKNNLEIAHILYLSEGHIRNQQVVIREKLNLRSSLELVVWGAKMGL